MKASEHTLIWLDTVDIDKTKQPEFSRHDFAAIAIEKGVFNSPEILELHELCINTEFPSEIAYDQGVLALLHAFDMQNPEQENLDTDTLVGIALCVADVHYQTEHYSYCLDELKFIEHRMALAEDESLTPFLTAAMEDVCSRIDDSYTLPSTPVQTAILPY